jgi:hypothetical protein
MAMGLIGLPWPNIDEDLLREYGEHIRAFGSHLGDTHGQMHVAFAGLSEANAGPASEAMLNTWNRISTTHLPELTEGCTLIALALEASAVAIKVAKDAILLALGVIVASLAADVVASVATLGLATAVEAGVIAGVRTAVKAILDQLEQALIAEALQAVLGPMEERLESAIQGMALQGLQAAWAL